MNQIDQAIKDGKCVFVFGSNLRGIHGAGAAAHAEDHWGAIRGKGIGHHGMSYAIPSKDQKINTMPLKAIQPYVETFIAYAGQHPELTFKVTQIGCGLAGYRPADIAPMFLGAPLNCWFDYAWKPWLEPTAQFWGSV